MQSVKRPSPSCYQNRIDDYNTFAYSNHCICDIRLNQISTLLQSLCQQWASGEKRKGSVEWRKSLTGLISEEDSLVRGEQRETKPNLGEGALAQGGDERSEWVGRRGLARNRRDPGLPSHHYSPTCGSPSHHYSPAPAELCPPSRPAACISVTPAAAGLRGRGRSAGPRAGQPRRGCRSGSPRHQVKVRPGAGRQQERKAAAEVCTGEMVAPPSPPTPQLLPVPHTGCTASSTREWCARRGARRTSSCRFPLTPTPVQQLLAAAAAATATPTPPHMGPGAARRCASLLLRRRRGLLRAALPPSSSSSP